MCVQPWNDALLACAADTGLGVPLDQTRDNYGDRLTICSSRVCQQFFAVSTKLIAEKCQGILDEQKKWPKAIWSATYCPTPPALATTKPPPPAETTTAPPPPKTPSPTIPPQTPPPTTTVPATTSATTTPVPAPAMTATPAPQSTSAMPDTGSSSSSSSSLNSSIFPVPVTMAPSVSTSDLEKNTKTTPSPTVLTVAKDATNATTLVAAGGGAVLLLVLIVALVVFVWVRRRTKRGSRDEEPEYEYGVPVAKLVDGGHADGLAATPRTEPQTATTGMLGGLMIAMRRIPLEKIHVGEIISQGGFGEVFHAVYNGKDVAVKRLLAARRKDPGNVESFLQEIRLTAALDHERIVTMIGVAWDAPSDLCMVSEFMAGGDLRSLLSANARRGDGCGFDDDKLRIAVQVAHALTYLHSLQPLVVHRDLKSRNILLTAELDAKLIDFGISTERRDLTMTAGVGTSLWMAPEVMMGERYDEKADIFSFGVVLSELDTHELPYAHARDGASSSSTSISGSASGCSGTGGGRKMPEMVVMQRVAQGRLTPRFSDNADPQIVKLALECLRVQPQLRPTAAEVLYRIHTTRHRGSATAAH